MIIDAHAHCGVQDTTTPQAFEDYLALAAGTGISKVAAFPPVMEIYDRFDPDFSDTPQWRQRSRDAMLHLNISRLAADSNP